MSNQDYYQSFQQDSAPGVPPTGPQPNYSAPYNQNHDQAYAQGAPQSQYYPGSDMKDPNLGNQQYYSQNNQNPGFQQNTFQAPNNQGDERGLAGAALGGVAGGVAGHQVHHGFLGTVGGALVGSITESAMKKHKKKEDKHDSSSDSDSSRSHGSHGGRRGRGGLRRGRGRGRG